MCDFIFDHEVGAIRREEVERWSLTSRHACPGCLTQSGFVQPRLIVGLEIIGKQVHGRGGDSGAATWLMVLTVTGFVCHFAVPASWAIILICEGLRRLFYYQEASMCQD
ncbi:hypothetical protein KC19_10G113000 [Ceratodon purpureus]|uniref:Uncharacterized protein n=1 Tax=Ceratodon purpureus TaxID=3225 RepID=A0A8T0GRE3_CERPU|nr:hypothetical protein KC19_10G113000 [Ceratodon purpureus]